MRDDHSIKYMVKFLTGNFNGHTVLNFVIYGGGLSLNTHSRYVILLLMYTLFVSDKIEEIAFFFFFITY